MCVYEEIMYLIDMLKTYNLRIPDSEDFFQGASSGS
jgi:hypothetical protein